MATDWFKNFPIPFAIGFVLGIAGAFVYMEFASGRSDRAQDSLAEELKIQRDEARGKVEAGQSQIAALQADKKLVEEKLLQTQLALQSATDTKTRCAQLFAFIEQKRRDVGAAEDRVRLAAPMAVKMNNERVLLNVPDMTDPYQRAIKSHEDAKRALEASESNWQACLRGEPMSPEIRTISGAN